VFVPLICVLAVVFVLFRRWLDQRYILYNVDLELGVTVGRMVLESRIRTLLVVASLYSFA